MSNLEPADPAHPMSDALVQAERLRRQRGRNLAVLAILVGLVVLIFAATIVKIKLGYRP